MKTKIVYVVVSSENDIYLEQFYISILSLRKNSPGCYVCLLTDQITSASFKNFRKKISEEADEIVVVNQPKNLNGQARSRLLKTSVRQHVKGDFLFVDCDTIILHSLDEIDNYKFNIAACLDSHSSLTKNPYRSMILDHGKINDIDFKLDKEYFNSGVILVKDVEENYHFYELWNELCKISFDKKIKMDQPSFNKANYLLNYPIKILPDKWNCELKHGLRYLKDPIILHYLCTNVNKKGDSQVFILNEKDFFMKIKETHNIPIEFLTCFDNHFEGFINNTQIISGNDISIHNSDLYYLIKKLYDTKVYLFFNWFSKSLRKIRNKI